MRLTRVATALTVLGVATFATGAPRSRASLRTRLDSVFARAPLRAAFVGAEVRSLADGRVLYARDADKSFTPASVLKLVTTAAALDVLGPLAKVTTTFEAVALPDSAGRLSGDLFLVGRGDATLARSSDGQPSAIDRLTDRLVVAGVRSVAGRLIGHEGLWTGAARVLDWPSGDLVWCYGAEVSALSFNDNCVDLRVSPGPAEGAPVTVVATPLSGEYRIESVAVTGAPGSEDELRLERDLGANLIRLSGRVPLASAPRQLRVALEHPARFAVSIVADKLKQRGIALLGGVTTSSMALPPDLRVLAASQGLPLSEALAVVNKPSQNLHAELLLRRLGTAGAGTAGAGTGGADTAETGLEAVRAFLQRARLPLDGVVLRDGSGLSPFDLVTPRLLTGLLAHMDRHAAAEVYRASLPVAGVDGTLKHRLKGTRTEGRVFAKTGSLRHAASLAGYATLAGGQRVAFAFLVNHASDDAAAQAALDAAVRALLE